MKAGIDEAGRGSLFGPLVIASYSIKKEKEKLLSELGIKDSKKISRKKREELFSELKVIGRPDFVVLSAEKLNRLMVRKNLNEIEAEFIASLMKKLPKNCEVFIDLPESIKRFRERISKHTSRKWFAEHRADDKYPIVSAASICAKVRRDWEIEKLKEEIGDFGSGYPADEKTRNFLISNLNSPWIKRYVRERWKTYKSASQRRLSFHYQ